MKLYVLEFLGTTWCVCDKKHLSEKSKALARLMTAELGYEVSIKDVQCKEMILNEEGL